VLAPFEERLEPVPAARFALETALLDLVARGRGVSVASLLAGGAPLWPIARSGLVDFASPTLTEDARSLLARQITTIKAKIGARALTQDLASLARLRDAVGPAVRIRLDANGAFSEPAAALDLLAPFDVELVEEPTRGEALLALGPCAVPWAADESLLDRRIARALLDTPSCAAIVVKPAIHGLRGALALCRAASVRHKPVIVTHLIDGPIAVAAACELALFVSTLRADHTERYASGLDPAPAVVWGAMRMPQLDVPGVITPHRGVGLGVSPAEGPARDPP
jgi:L-alanine-DL-glutamate epimerase-like enolase superfamily enzyme